MHFIDFLARCPQSVERMVETEIDRFLSFLGSMAGWSPEWAKQEIEAIADHVIESLGDFDGWESVVREGQDVADPDCFDEFRLEALNILWERLRAAAAAKVEKHNASTTP